MSDTPDRRLVVNADDFGRSEAINEGVLRGHVDGIVTSASLMVRQPVAAEAVAMARDHPDLGLGLHIDLAEWELVEGEWLPTYQVVDTADHRTVRSEIERQLETFRALVGEDPTHLDSHQHVHRDDPVGAIALRLATELGIPLRGRGPIHTCGAFYGQDRQGRSVQGAVGPDALIGLLHSLPPGESELCCHPAAAAEPFTSYSVERPIELRSLCDPAVRRATRELDIRLCNFRQLRHNRETKGPTCSRR